ncbi:hypothetical protein Pan44_14990 [Caulifigura coniformis]|uniref:Uncharacterized protein n=1 Tax=Caulifigura coniformis TaxID=2527983 RepID=A0A517SBJ5_9PLAN|nr:hypothetical protein Pan44_14990 [Caulifigura coniformis]
MLCSPRTANIGSGPILSTSLDRVSSLTQVPSAPSRSPAYGLRNCKNLGGHHPAPTDTKCARRPSRTSHARPTLQNTSPRRSHTTKQTSLRALPSHHTPRRPTSANKDTPTTDQQRRRQRPRLAHFRGTCAESPCPPSRRRQHRNSPAKLHNPKRRDPPQMRPVLQRQTEQTDAIPKSKRAVLLFDALRGYIFSLPSPAAIVVRLPHATLRCR